MAEEEQTSRSTAQGPVIGGELRGQRIEAHSKGGGGRVSRRGSARRGALTRFHEKGPRTVRPRAHTVGTNRPPERCTDPDNVVSGRGPTKPRQPSTFARARGSGGAVFSPYRACWEPGWRRVCSCSGASGALPESSASSASSASARRVSSLGGGVRASFRGVWIESRVGGRSRDRACLAGRRDRARRHLRDLRWSVQRRRATAAPCASPACSRRRKASTFDEAF